MGGYSRGILLAAYIMGILVHGGRVWLDLRNLCLRDGPFSTSTLIERWFSRFSALLFVRRRRFLRPRVGFETSGGSCTVH